MRIVRRLPEKMGLYRIYADSWYGREEFAEELHLARHYFTIACRATRSTYLFKLGLPEELQPFYELDEVECWIYFDGCWHTKLEG